MDGTKDSDGGPLFTWAAPRDLGDQSDKEALVGADGGVKGSLQAIYPLWE